VQWLTAQALADPRAIATLPAAYREMAAGDFRRIATLAVMFRMRLGVESAMKHMMDLSSGATPARLTGVALAIYRHEIIIPFGFLSMLIQAAIFAWIYEKAFAQQHGTWGARALIYGAVGVVLSWSFTTLAVAAKNVMASVPSYLMIETAFTIVQWLMVAPLTALASALGRRNERVSTVG
jgi:hypothetical protein